MAVGDLYRLKDFQSMAGQQILNVYYFEQTLGSGGAEALNIAFTLDVLPAVRNMQSASLVHTILESENLDDVADFDTVTLGALPGNRDPEFAPLFVAYSFIMQRTTKATRHGHKRIGGVGDSNVVDGEANATVLPHLTAYADLFPGPITDVLGNEYMLVIIRNPDDPGTRIVNPVSDAAYQRVTSQNTRKIGSGA